MAPTFGRGRYSGSLWLFCWLLWLLRYGSFTAAQEACIFNEEEAMAQSMLVHAFPYSQSISYRVPILGQERLLCRAAVVLKRQKPFFQCQKGILG